MLDVLTAPSFARLSVDKELLPWAHRLINDLYLQFGNVGEAINQLNDTVGVGGPFQPLDADLTAIAALAGTGIACRTGVDTWALRNIVDAGGGRIVISNPGGVAGDPTLDVSEAALDLANIGGQVNWLTQIDFTNANIADIPLRSHSDLMDLIAPFDDHTQYLYMDGRGGGQTAHGGNATLENLVLRSTSFATPNGVIVLGDAIDTPETVVVHGTDPTIQINGTPFTSRLSVYNESIDEGNLNLINHNTSSSVVSTLLGARSRGDGATPTVVADNDVLLRLQAVGFDGTDYERAAQILFEVEDATPGPTSMGGALVFFTTPTSSVVLAERFRIGASGRVYVTGSGLSVNALDYIWPGSHASGQLTNDGAGNLTWTAAAGAGTVTSVAGGVGITNTPEPIVGAGTVDLDLFSLSTEPIPATGDWFAFVDVSVGTGPSAQRKVTIDDLVTALETLISHSDLQDLVAPADDHTQYFHLPGRAGGQSAAGGTAAADNLELDPSSAANYSGKIVVGANAGTYGGVTQLLDLWPNTITLGVSSDITAIGWSGIVGPAANGTLMTGISMSPSVGISGAFSTLQHIHPYEAESQYTNITANNHTIADFTSFYARPVAAATGAGNAEFILWTGLTVDADLTSVSGHVDVGLMKGVYVINPTVTDAGGTTVIGECIGLDCEDFTLGGVRATIRSAQNAATDAWFLLGTGTASSSMVGGLRIGDNTAPVELLEVAGDAIVEGSGLSINGLPYVWPASEAANRVLKTDGASVLSWGQVAFSELTGTLAHSALSGLTGPADDHTQYLLLAGRSGGQVAYGGTATGNHLDLGANDETWTAGEAGRIRLKNQVTFPDNWTLTAGDMESLIEAAATYTFPTGSNTIRGYYFHPTLTYAAAQTLSFSPAFQSSPIYQPSAALTDTLCFWSGFDSSPRYTPTAGSCVGSRLMGYLARPYSKSGLTTTIDIVSGFTSYANTFDPYFDSSLTINNLRHFECFKPDNTGTGDPTVTNHVGLYIGDLGYGTTKLSLQSLGSGVEMRHAGPGVFGANAAVTNASVALEVQSTTQAFLTKGMTRAQRNTLTGVAVADGMLLFENNTALTTHSSRHNASWVELPGWDICISKAADQTVTNSVTLTDDTDLQFAVTAGDVWQFELLLSMTGSAAAGDGKFQLLATVATFSNSWRSGVHFDAAGALVTGLWTPAAFTSTTEMVTSGGLTVLNGDTNPFPVYFKGAFRASASATVKVQFANVAASSGRTTVMKAGSMIRAKRMLTV